MYFSEFESYSAAVDKATSVIIRVQTVDGVHDSSAIPVTAINTVISDLEEFYGSKSVLMIWNKHFGSLASFAHERVISVKLLLS